MKQTAHYVVLHIGAGRTNLQDPSLTSIGNAGPFELTPDIWIERLKPELAKRIIRACEPLPLAPTVEHDRHVYAWVRPVPEGL